MKNLLAKLKTLISVLGDKFMRAYGKTAVFVRKYALVVGEWAAALYRKSLAFFSAKFAALRSSFSGLSKKAVAFMLACAAVAGCGVFGTVAWLTAKTEKVENTFTVGDVGVTLVETKEDFKMIPGFTIDKDPVVTVDKDSEDCYLFVKVEESENLGYYLYYNISIDEWIPLSMEKYPGVYYKAITDETGEGCFNKGVPYSILAAGSDVDSMGTADASDDIAVTWKDNQVAVKPCVTKEMMEAVKDDPTLKPTLTFTAYAVQMYKGNDAKFTPDEAWALVSP